MSHNKRKQMRLALVYLDKILDLEAEEFASLPGSVIKHVREAKKSILKDKMMQKDEPR
jgi:hypothetical protein